MDLSSLVKEAKCLRQAHQPNATITANIEYDGDNIDFMFIVNGKVLIEVFENDVTKGMPRFKDLIMQFIIHEREVLNDED